MERMMRVGFTIVDVNNIKSSDDMYAKDLGAAFDSLVVQYPGAKFIRVEEWGLAQDVIEDDYIPILDVVTIYNRYCHVCGEENVIGRRQCWNCGKLL